MATRTADIGSRSGLGTQARDVVHDSFQVINADRRCVRVRPGIGCARDVGPEEADREGLGHHADSEILSANDRLPDLGGAGVEPDRRVGGVFVEGTLEVQLDPTGSGICSHGHRVREDVCVAADDRHVDLRDHVLGGESPQSLPGLFKATGRLGDGVVYPWGRSVERDLRVGEARGHHAFDKSVEGEESAVGLRLDQRVAELSGVNAERREVFAEGRLSAKEDHLDAAGAPPCGEGVSKALSGALSVACAEIRDGAVCAPVVALGAESKQQTLGRVDGHVRIIAAGRSRAQPPVLLTGSKAKSRRG